MTGTYSSNRHLVWLCVLYEKKPVINQHVEGLIEGANDKKSTCTSLKCGFLQEGSYCMGLASY